MLTTLPNRVSALLADPFHAAMRELTDDYGFRGNVRSLQKIAPLSIWEDNNAFYVEADVPGIAIEDLDVSLEKGKLTIRGERKPSREGEAQYDERFCGQFSRTIALNEWVDPDRIEASLVDGVLHLTLSKKPESQRQQIKIAHARSNDSMKHIETETK